MAAVQDSRKLRNAATETQWGKSVGSRGRRRGPRHQLTRAGLRFENQLLTFTNVKMVLELMGLPNLVAGANCAEYNRF